MFFVKSNLTLFAPCGEPSVFALMKSSLDCRLWQWQAYLLESVLLLAGCCERVFFTMEMILWSSTTVVLCGRPGLFMLLGSPVHSFFLRMYQTVDLATPNVPAISLMDLFCFWSLTIVCFTCMERSFDRMMWVHSNSFQMQMTHLESTPDFLPA